MMKEEGTGMENASLPFSVTLEDFRLQRYPGSHSPMSYESDLVIKRENESPLQATIRMNKVIDVDGYRLFQSSFDSDEQGTVLSVSYDRPGMQLTYTGYFLLLVGFVLTLFSKKSRFGRLRRELGEMKRIPLSAYCSFWLYPASPICRHCVHNNRLSLHNNLSSFRNYLVFLPYMPKSLAVW